MNDDLMETAFLAMGLSVPATTKSGKIVAIGVRRIARSAASTQFARTRSH